VAKMAGRFMREPQEVKLTERHAATKIRQRFYEVKDSERLHAVGLLLNHYLPASTLAFCNTKQQCRDLLQVLRGQGFAALELHGDLDQRERDQVMVRFANRSCSVLVATDIAARGLDIAQLEAVINVDISPDPATHTHRIGRTGRVDAVGDAFTLMSPDEQAHVAAIERFMGRTVPRVMLPDFDYRMRPNEISQVVSYPERGEDKAAAAAPKGHGPARAAAPKGHARVVPEKKKLVIKVKKRVR
jgi:ATP-independent RNA helicase DbpA